MALICDTGGVFGLYDADDAHHASIKAIVEQEPGPLFLPVALLAEIDYLLSTRLGQEAALDFLESVEQGAYLLVPMLAADLRRCLELIRQYRDLELGVADAAAAAERLGVKIDASVVVGDSVWDLLAARRARALGHARASVAWRRGMGAVGHSMLVHRALDSLQMSDHA